MSRPSLLLAGAALGALLLADPALAAGRHKRPPSAEQQEIEALKAQLAALNARLSAEEQALQASLTKSEAAAEAVRQTAARTDAAAARVETAQKALPDQVAQAVAAQVKPAKPDWTAATKIGGIVFADATSISQKTNGTKVPTTGTGIDVKRVYISVDHRFNEVFSADVTTDASYSSGAGNVSLFAKKAYLEAKLSDALALSAGSNSLPWAPYVESLYGFRYVEKTLIDRAGVGTTTDWGAHAGGKLADGLLGYQLSVVNGGGYKNPSRSSGMDVEGRVNLAWQGLNLGLGGYSGKLGKAVEGAPALHRAERFNVVLAYVQPAYRIGVDYFSAKNWTAVTSVAADKADGVSYFGSLTLLPKTTLFGRYDTVKPNRDTAPAKKDIYYNLGLAYALDPQIDAALVYKREKVTGGAFAGSNGTIGSASGAKLGTYDEIGGFLQFKY